MFVFNKLTLLANETYIKSFMSISAVSDMDWIELLQHPFSIEQHGLELKNDRMNSYNSINYIEIMVMAI